MAAVTFNPSATDAYITLSNGNLSAQESTLEDTDEFEWTLATAPITGKCYWEVVWTAFSLGASTGPALGLAGSLSNTGLLGFEPGTMGWRNGGTGTGETFLYTANGNFINVQPWAQAQICQMAFDTTAQLLWVNVNNGNWNNGTGTPIGEVAGYSFAAISGPLYMTVGFDDTGQGNSVTANFGASAFIYAPPAGFVGLSSLASTGSLMGQACLRVIQDGKKIVREWLKPKSKTIYLPSRKLILPARFAQ